MIELVDQCFDETESLFGQRTRFEESLQLKTLGTVVPLGRGGGFLEECKDLHRIGLLGTTACRISK